MRPVAGCVDQVSQVVQQAGDLIGAEELGQLQARANDLESRYHAANAQADKLIRRIQAAYDELNKFWVIQV